MPDSAVSNSETPHPLRVFLCHSSADKSAVRELYARLCADGVDVWFDEESLVAGQSWRVEIPKAVRNSDVVIVCLSRAAISRAGYVQKEITFALDVAEEQPEGTIFIIPLKLEECKVPERLSGWHWVNYFELTGYERLMRALRLRAQSLRSDTVSSSKPTIPPVPEQATAEVHRQPGGVSVDATQVNVGDDVVGRDKVVSAGGHIIHAESGATVIINEQFTPESVKHEAHQDQEQLAKERAERDRLGREQAEQEQLAKEKAKVKPEQRAREWDQAVAVLIQRLRRLITPRRALGGLIALGALVGLYLIANAVASGNSSLGVSATPTMMTIAAVPTATSAVNPTGLISTQLPAPTLPQQSPTSYPSPEPAPLAPISTSLVMSTSVQPPVTTKSVDRVTLDNEETISFAADWLEYIDGSDVLSAGLPLTRRGEVLFSDLKSAEVYTSATTYSDITITVALLNGTKIIDTLRSGGRLKGLAPEGVLAIPLAKIRHIDFGLTAETPITVNMTTVVNSSGEEIQTPTDLLEADIFVRSSMVGSYTYAQDGLPLTPGIMMPFSKLRSLKVDSITGTLDYTLTCSLLDGRTVVDRLDNTGSSSIRGLTNLGAFTLPVHDIRQIDFHRTRTAPSPLSTSAMVTLRDGKTISFAADWLEYINGNVVNTLSAGLPLTRRGEVSFSDLQSVEVYTSAIPYVEGYFTFDNITITVELLNGTKITDTLLSGGHLKGLTPDGVFAVPLANIQHIDFRSTAETPITVNMTAIVNSSGMEIQIPTDLLEAAFVGSSMAGPYTYVKDGLSVVPGVVMPFNMLRSLKIDHITDTIDYTLTCLLLDGSTVVGRLDNTDSPSIRGLSNLGAFNLPADEIRQINFPRIRDALSPLSNLATVTLRDGSTYNIPTVWLAYSRHDWIGALPTSKNGNLYFKLMKSLEIQVGPGSSNITATIQLLKDQTLVDKVAEYGDDHLVGITTDGQWMDARLGDVKRVDFSAAPFLLPPITRGTITMRSWQATKSGVEIKTPVNSVKISFGEGGQAGYFWNYTNDLPLSLGTSMPFSKMRSFKIGDYDSGQGYAITLYLLDGQTLETHLKSTALDISIDGLSDIGPFNVAINYVASVDFNR